MFVITLLLLLGGNSYSVLTSIYNKLWCYFNANHSQNLSKKFSLFSWTCRHFGKVMDL